MVDIAFSGRTRMIAGARVEGFKQDVNTFDPFGLFVRKVTATNENTDIFPAINFVQAMAGNSNLRLSYGSTVMTVPAWMLSVAFSRTNTAPRRT